MTTIKKVVDTLEHFYLSHSIRYIIDFEHDHNGAVVFATFIIYYEGSSRAGLSDEFYIDVYDDTIILDAYVDGKLWQPIYDSSLSPSHDNYFSLIELARDQFRQRCYEYKHSKKNNRELYH